MAPDRALTAVGLLAGRVRIDGASPLVTFYDDATGERVELSAVTFANWVAKTANLLVDGLGCGPGDTATVALPVHWQSLVVVAGSWAAGLSVGFESEGGEVAFAVEGAETAAHGEQVRLSLRPMGAGLTRPDADVMDYAAEVLTYGDYFNAPEPDPSATAVPGLTHAALIGTPKSLAAQRVSLAPGGDPLLDVELLVAAYLTPLVTGGSVVLTRHADPGRIPHRLAEERATAALTP